MISLLVEVHRCPQVPTAAKTKAGIEALRSVDSVNITALFPPSSNKGLPHLYTSRSGNHWNTLVVCHEFPNFIITCYQTANSLWKIIFFQHFCNNILTSN